MPWTRSLQVFRGLAAFGVVAVNRIFRVNFTAPTSSIMAPPVDRIIIRSVRGNGGELSNKLKQNFPLLEESGIGQEIVGIVAKAFADADPGKQVGRCVNLGAVVYALNVII
jgi:hypothetical protein